MPRYVSFPQYRALEILRANDGLTQQVLRVEHNVRRDVIGALEKGWMVERRGGDPDQEHTTVHITEYGRRARPPWEKPTRGLKPSVRPEADGPSGP